jgi:hypothetical protein
VLCCLWLQITCNASSGDLPVSADTLGDRAATVRNYAFASFWVQLPLTIVSAGILFFAISFSKAVSVLICCLQHQSNEAGKHLKSVVCAAK